MEFAKDLVSNVGSATADFAKMVGGNTAHIAKRVGGRSVKLAKDVGPKRGLVGLALVGAAVGSGIFLVRYLRGRAAARVTDANGVRSKKMSKAESRAQHAAQIMH
jgi:hypothetical protein